MVEVFPPTDNVDITINIGSTFILDFVEQIDTGGGAVPRDLTGYTIRATIRKGYNKEPALIELTVANNRVIETDLTNGEYRLFITDDDLIGLNRNKALDNAVWDLEQVEPGGTVTRMYEGTVILIPEATT